MKNRCFIIVSAAFSLLSISLCATDEEFSSYYSPDTGMQAQAVQEKNHFSYGPCPRVAQLLATSFYHQAVESLPIMCVDIFVVDLATNRYLLVYRKNRPAKGTFWVPGGRILKGESFFESAERKCCQELGIQIIPHEVVGIYNLIFPDSEWETATHTPAVVVLATYDPQEGSVSLDELHANFRWVSLFEPNTIDYIEDIRQKVLKLLG
jgi:colanic acid biosynthesis protein WcaH